MKKFLVLTICAVMSISMLAACSAKQICDFCGKEKSCEEKSFLGEKVVVCTDCLDELE